MSFTLAGLLNIAAGNPIGVLLEESNRERARRDYEAAKSDEGVLYRQFLYDRAMEKSASTLSKLMEPGYSDEIFELIKEDEEADRLLDYWERYRNS